MGLDEYILGLLAIISGLAISEMVAELHTLLFNRKSVKWHWLAPMTAFYVALAILASWWVAWGSFSGRTEPIALGMFLVPVVQLVALFLAARGILPTNLATPDGGKFNLEEHYFLVKRYVWGAMTANALVTLTGMALVGIFSPFVQQDEKLTPPTMAVAASAFLLLALSNNRWLHRLLVPTLLGWFLVAALGSTIAP